MPSIAALPPLFGSRRSWDLHVQSSVLQVHAAGSTRAISRFLHKQDQGSRIQPSLRHSGQLFFGKLESIAVKRTKSLRARAENDCLLLLGAIAKCMAPSKQRITAAPLRNAGRPWADKSNASSSGRNCHISDIPDQFAFQPVSSAR